LPRHGSMVPINALAGEFVAAELHNDDQIESVFFVGRGTFGKNHCIGLSCVKVWCSSSTNWPAPTTRLIVIVCKSSGQEGMKWSR